MTVSLKRRRAIAQEAKGYAGAFRLARAYAKAGDTEMADYFLNSVKFRKRSPAEAAWLIVQARKRMKEIAAEDYERRMQGLPRPEYEYKKPQLH